MHQSYKKGMKQASHGKSAISCTSVQALPLGKECLASINDTRVLLAADLLAHGSELSRPPRRKAALTWPRSTSGAVHSGVPAWLLADIHVLRRTRDSPKSQTCMRLDMWQPSQLLWTPANTAEDFAPLWSFSLL